MAILSEFRGKEGNILILTYWSFSDALIQTYTLPYVRMIRKVLPANKRIFLLTLEREPGVTINNLPEGINWIPVSYNPFGWKASIEWVINGAKLCRLILKANISFIHCWGTPAGAIGFVLSRLTGRILILDSYEPHAESMVENGTWLKTDIAYRLLFWLEKKQSQNAVCFISATDGMRHYAKEKYGVEPKNFFVKPAGVNLDLFHPREIKRPEIMASLGLVHTDVVCVYAGKFGGIYLDQEVFDFFSVAQLFWRDRFKFVLLTNTPADEIRSLCKNSGIDPQKVIQRFVPHHEIPAYMGVADFAITPVKPVPSKRFCTPIKNGEYWALGLPVVIPANISDDAAIIESNDIGAVLYELNAGAYLNAVMRIDNLLQRPDLKTAIRGVAIQYRSFANAERIYNEIYSRL